MHNIISSNRKISARQRLEPLSPGKESIKSGGRLSEVGSLGQSAGSPMKDAGVGDGLKGPFG